MESTNKMQTAQTASPVSLFISPICDGRADPYAKRLHDVTFQASEDGIFLCTDNLRSDKDTSEAESSIWSAFCNASLPLVSAYATETTRESEFL